MTSLPQVLSKTVDGTSTYYIYGLGLIAEETGIDYKTYHYDQRGSTTALTDSTGNVTDTYDYGPYGELISHTGTSQVDYLYNGRDGVITDSEDLYYMRARYYSTELRRFLSEDNYAGKYDNILGMNLYGYVNGNPVQYVDPSGNDGELTGDKNFESPFLVGSVNFLIVYDVNTLLDPNASMFDKVLAGSSFIPGFKGFKVGSKVEKSLIKFNLQLFASKGGSELAFKTGKAGEEYLAKLVGGESQVYFKTSQGGRYIDQLAGDIAYESKVGYTSLTEFAKKQILKDAELIEQGLIKGANWNFFKSDVTGKVGA